MREALTIRDEAVIYFDAFVKAFQTFDGEIIAQRYLSPYLAMHADGTIECFSTNAEVAQYFQTVVDEYHVKGCRPCRYHDLDAVPVGNGSALATVTWELVHDDGSIISCWRESYTLSRIGGPMRAFASVDHAE